MTLVNEKLTSTYHRKKIGGTVTKQKGACSCVLLFQNLYTFHNHIARCGTHTITISNLTVE